VALGIYYLFIWINPALYQVGNLTGWTISVLNSFLLNRKFVFKDSTEHPLKTLGKVYLIYGVSFVLTVAMLHIQIEWIGISEFIAPLLCMIVTIPVNFLANKFWAFRAKKKAYNSDDEE